MDWQLALRIVCGVSAGVAMGMLFRWYGWEGAATGAVIYAFGLLAGLAANND